MRNPFEDKELVFHPLPQAQQIELGVIICLLGLLLAWDTHPTLRLVTRLVFGFIIALFCIAWNETKENFKKKFK